MTFRGWVSSKAGNQRESNQDAYLLEPERGVFAVADGMGGKAQGGRASLEVVEKFEAQLEELEELLRRSDPASDRRHRAQVHDFLVQRLRKINRELYDESEGEMGTTCDVLVLYGGAGFVAHVGDSRVYLLRDGEIHQITDDHTFAEKVRREQRLRGEEESPQLRRRYQHVLTRSIGGEPEVDVDTLFVDVQPGDRFLLCSDGVNGVLSDQKLLEVDQSSAPEKVSEALVETALEEGSTDNVTAIVVSVPEGAGREFGGETPVETLRKVSFLQQLDLFEDLESQELMKVLRIVYKEEHRAGETIIEQGTTPARMYMILEGRVSLRVEGHEIAELVTGAHFGEMALFGEHPRSADVVAVEDVVLLVVPSEQFHQLVEVEDIELGNKILRNLLNRAASRIRETTLALLGAREGPDAKAAAVGRADTLELDSDAIDLADESG